MTKDAFGIIFPRFVKPIHVELPYEAINFPMTKIFWENDFLELVYILDDKISTGGSPEYNFGIFVILNKERITFKI